MVGRQTRRSRQGFSISWKRLTIQSRERGGVKKNYDRPFPALSVQFALGIGNSDDYTVLPQSRDIERGMGDRASLVDGTRSLF